MKLETKLIMIEYIGAFCLGTSLAGIFGLLDGTLLSVAIIILYETAIIRLRYKHE